VQINFCTKQQSSFNGLLHFVKILLTPFLFFTLAISAHGNDIDVDKLIQIAKKQNKYIMFFQHIPRCPYCKTMLDENFKDATILREIDKNFIYVDIFTANKGSVKFNDFEGSYKEFSAHIGAFVYPSTIFMNDKGEVVHRAIGYRNVDEYFTEITYISTKSYKTMDLESYVLKLEMEDF
jgi:thioredoxin-related protein